MRITALIFSVNLLYSCAQDIIPDKKHSAEAILLGTAQDGGIPHAGCECDNCKPLLEANLHSEYVSSLGLIDHKNRQFWIIDVTPDFPRQLYMIKKLAPNYVFSGIILTHAHIGHYTGLIYLGKEVMNSKHIPVYVTQKFARFIQDNDPWSTLIEFQNIKIVLIEPDKEFKLSNNLTFTPILVPHRDELSDTIAIIVNGATKKLFYCPDTDSWKKWGFDAAKFISSIDIALLDGTFYDSSEVKHRNIKEIPHPFIDDSCKLLKGLKTDIRFIHLNHTNPLYNKSKEKEIFEHSGFKIGRKGDRWQLD
ncbi:MAG: pyrroloquinoline quinone biosynthesis protein PqqB [Planctomycetes bacterium]|nr:pyrroloquinoline quinone biosynthesis protein PqqB [Planctomycetota bacterium]